MQQVKNITPFFISLSIHMLFLYALTYQATFKPKKLEIITVDLNSLFPKEKPRIISPSDKNNNIAPKNNVKLSDKDNTVKKETIKRGTNTPGSKAPTKAATKPVEKKRSEPSENESFNTKPSSTTKDKIPVAEKQIASNLNSILGSSGVQDFAPDIRDGELTLLNTKASKYAVFVRRVATAVFNKLKALAWSGMDYTEVKKIGGFNEYKAILDKQGKLLKVVKNDSSKSILFDSTLEKAIEISAHDPNPPVSAIASDGNYHFIFQAKMFTRLAPGGRNRAPRESRWLIMRAGLE